MTLPPPSACRRIRKLFALLGSPNPNEAANAKERLLKLLAKHGLTWNDLASVLAADYVGASNRKAAPQAPASAPAVNVLDLLLVLLERYVAITAEERMAVALWCLHTYVFDNFSITPRLALLSPVQGCGKTTLLVLLELLVAEPYRSDHTTAAAIFHELDRQLRSLLIDEGDNLGLFANGVLRSVFNSGHRRGGGVSRFIGGRSRKFSTFAPLAVAAIGVMPLPLMHRSIVINMQRSSVRLEQLDELDPTFPAVREELRKWAATCSLARDPEIPSSLRNRAADNCRVLLAIADSLGHGGDARAALVALCAYRSDEAPGVLALTDIRTVFNGRGADRIASAALIEAMLAQEDGIWNDWRGPNDDRAPRKLNQAELARLLRPFGIRPRTIWPAARGPRARSYRGYLRGQFEAAWAAYCPAADTPTQDRKIIHLPRA